MGLTFSAKKSIFINVIKPAVIYFIKTLEHFVEPDRDIYNKYPDNSNILITLNTVQI